MERDRKRRWALVALTIVALPSAWLVEQLLARFVLPSDLRLVQEHFAEPLRPVGWALVGATRVGRYLQLGRTFKSTEATPRISERRR